MGGEKEQAHTWFSRRRVQRDYDKQDFGFRTHSFVRSAVRRLPRIASLQAQSAFPEGGEHAENGAPEGVQGRREEVFACRQSGRLDSAEFIRKFNQTNK